MNAQLNSRRLQRDCRAFTLVELLVVISIITLLASTALFTMYGVREDVRDTRARAQITKINELIMEKWEAYRTRALPIRIPAGTDPRAAAALRLDAVRELMRMELPDRVTDLCLGDRMGNWVTTTDFIAGGGDPRTRFSTTPLSLTSPPSAWRQFQQRIASAAARGKTWSTLHEPSECLYMILAGIREADSTGLEWFSEGEIGDTDDDGMPEILDPWGMPIYFLRWAPGYSSDLQNPSRREPDPFDPLRVDPRWVNTNADQELDDPFILYPLIYSAGRDKQYGVVRKDYYDHDSNPSTPHLDAEIWYVLSNSAPEYLSAQLTENSPPGMPYRFPNPPWALNYAARFPVLPNRPMNDPYLILPRSGDWIGRRWDGNYLSDDDITNQLLEVR